MGPECKVSFFFPYIGGRLPRARGVGACGFREMVCHLSFERNSPVPLRTYGREAAIRPNRLLR
jgi:hypothetical protein